MFLVGESGIGKSRLMDAAADLGFAHGMRLMRGRSSTTGPLVPFRALTEAVLSLLRAGWAGDVDALGPYRPVLGRLVPDLRCGPVERGDASLVILGEAVLRLTALAGHGRGCLLTLDDLHDADSETLAVAEYLVDNCADLPFLLLGTVREQPCPAMDLARAVVQRGRGVLLELDRLSRTDVTRMVGSYLGVEPAQVPGPVNELLWVGSTGNPFLVEEMLADLIDNGQLVPEANGWRMSDATRVNRPGTFARSVGRRIGQVPAPARELAMAGAVLGPRFPLTVAQSVAGLPDRELPGHLRTLVDAQLLVGDDQSPDWYGFQHPLVHEALLSLLAPPERAHLARRAADAVQATFPDLAGEWCQVSATLRLAAGQRAEAGRLFAAAGRRSLAQGAAKSAVTLLDRARELLLDDDAAVRADVLEALILALCEAGLVNRALAAVDDVDQVESLLDRRRRAQLHTRLAWAAVLAGESTAGLARVRAARALLGPDPVPADVAPIDVVAAHLELGRPGPDRLRESEVMARRAATVAEATPLPVAACQAWLLLGALIRHRDPGDATACLERSRAIAVRHDLPIWEIHTLVRLGIDDAMRDGRTERLEQARAQASRIGAVTARYQAEASIALQAILRADFDRARDLIDDVVTATTRLKLLETAEQVLLLRAVLAGHRGNRRDMELALAQVNEAHADGPRRHSHVHGLARTFCALLEEDRPLATREAARALEAERANPTPFQFTGRYGVHVLLAALPPTADRAVGHLVSAASASPFRWDRHYGLLARAVLAGRAGDHAGAATTVGEALAMGAPYTMGRHLGLRLVAEAALADGWGTPADWLRTVEEYFHRTDVPAVAGACRALLRTAGVRVPQRRSGFHQIPAALRAAGVTVREYEVLQLLVDRPGNREIADRLHLSPRTVERYISNLMAKIGLPNRIALSAFAVNGYRH